MNFFKSNKGKLNNAGFTLVELLVAITILGVIVGPMLYAFVYSTSMNSKSRRNLNANTVASDIAEGLKANSIKTVAGQMDFYSTTEFDIINPDIIKGAKTVGELAFDGTDYSDITVKSATRSTFTDPVTGAVTINYEHALKLDGSKQNNGIYYFYIDDIQPKKEKYDALIKLDARNYQAGSTKYVGDPNKKFRYNEYEMPTFTSVNGKSYVQMEDDSLQVSDPASALYRLAVATMPGLTPTESMLHRKIVIDITQDASLNKKATVTYIYTLEGAGVSTPVSVTNQYVIYDSTTASEDLKKLYLFYYPMYLSRGGDIHDEIEINNLNDLDVDMYLIKQELTRASLLTDETLYKVNVTVRESTTYTDAKLNLFTNIDYNLYHMYEESVPADVNQGYYKYNSLSNQTTVKNALAFNNLSSAEAVDRFFDMTITIFKENAITASGYDFSDEKKLYELTGSTLQ